MISLWTKNLLFFYLTADENYFEEPQKEKTGASNFIYF